MIEINRHPRERDLRIFAVLQLLFFAFIAWRIRPGLDSTLWPRLLVGAAGVACLVGLVRPSWVRPYFVGWLYAVFPIGWTISHLLIAAIYYLLMTPLGLLARAVGHDPLQLKHDPSRPSHWIERTGGTRKSQYFKQY